MDESTASGTSDDALSASIDSTSPLLTQPPFLSRNGDLASTPPSPSHDNGTNHDHPYNISPHYINNEDTFDSLNASYYPLSFDHVVVPSHCVDVIVEMLQDAWGISSPRPYQIKAIFLLVFYNVEMLYLICKTGEGKSMVLLGAASLLGGIVISLVPLLGLGADQVKKCNKQFEGFEAYHVDEFRDEYATHLIRHRAPPYLLLKPFQTDHQMMEPYCFPWMKLVQKRASS